LTNHKVSVELRRTASWKRLGIEKNPNRVKALLRAIARNISGEAKITTLVSDLISNDEALSYVTVDGYLKALGKIFVIEDLPAWSAKLKNCDAHHGETAFCRPIYRDRCAAGRTQPVALGFQHVRVAV